MSANGRRFSYLLRLWEEQGDRESHWRLSLQDVHSGEQYGFRCLDDLCAYLRYRMAGSDQNDRSIESSANQP